MNALLGFTNDTKLGRQLMSSGAVKANSLAFGWPLDVADHSSRLTSSGSMALVEVRIPMLDSPYPPLFDPVVNPCARE